MALINPFNKTVKYDERGSQLAGVDHGVGMRGKTGKKPGTFTDGKPSKKMGKPPRKLS